MIEVYTSITGDKDAVRDDIKRFPDYDKFKNPVMNAKVYKILSHKYLDADITIWLDGNIYLLVPPEQVVEEWLGDADMAVFKHNHRWLLYKEVEILNQMFKDRTPWVKDEINKQIEHYYSIGIPRETKLSMCGMIIRRNSPIVNQFNEAWWAEICRWSQRDQLSFPVVVGRFPELKVNYVKGNIKNHPYLRYETHAHFKT
jgi:hypothetical protein